MWSRGLDYDHGTGHGVGFVMDIHEGPNSIRYRGSHGIRTENLIVCRKSEKNEYGQFMEFENLTMVPVDVDALDVSLMEQRDIDNLNAYHRQVYDKISPHLTAEEAE